MDEASAKRALENQEISGYLLIPDQFVQSVMSGENKKITVVVGYGRYDVATLLVEELAKIVSSMITESQAGITPIQTGPEPMERMKILMRMFCG